MESTRIIRKIDNLGRIVIPKELRRAIAYDGAAMEFHLENNMICLKPVDEYQRPQELFNALLDSLDYISNTVEHATICRKLDEVGTLLKHVEA